MSMPHTLGILLSQTFKTTTQLLPKLLVGAVVFGVVLGFTQYHFQSSVQSQVNQMIGGAMDTDRVTELLEAGMAGDQAAMEEYTEEMEGMAAGAMEAIDAQAVAEIVGGSLGIMALVFLISVIALMFYFLAACFHTKSTGELINMSFKNLLPYLGLSIWVTARSFIWVPFIGFIFGIIFLPRLMFAAIIMFKEGKGVFESTTLSWQRTAGYWGKVVGNTLVLMVILMLAAMVINMMLGTVLGTMTMGSVIASTIVMQLVYATVAVFTVLLAETLFANRRS